jgi:hypothetical protein
MKLNLATINYWTIAALLLTGSSPAFAQRTNSINPRDFTTFRLIVNRNIFDVNRRPPVVNHQFTNTVVYSFSLVGTMNYEKGLYAVFDGTSQDYHKVLESGGKIATYTVSDITHDSCKLTYGTNQIELRVGMQMRRNTDGSWSAAEHAGESSYAFNSNSRFGNNTGRFNRSDRSDRGDRGSRFGNGFSGRNNYRTGDRSFGGSGNESNMGGPPGGAMDSGGAPPATGGSTDPNDVVARLMALRNAQLGQGQGQNDGGNQEPDQNAQGGNQNDNSNGNQNVPNQNQPNENQGGPPTGTENNSNNSNQNQNGTETSTPRT